MKKLIYVLITVSVIGTGALSANAERPTFDVEIGAGLMSGDTTYQIGGKTDFDNGYEYTYRFPISELKFPLDVYMASLESSVNFEDRWSIHIEAKKNITDDAGQMEDSDWGVWYESGCGSCSRDSLDVFSESDAELDALIINIDFHFRVFKKMFNKSSLSLFFSYGYMYENFDFEVSDLDQWYPSYMRYFASDGGHDKVDGDVLEYEIDYHIPYIGFGTTYTMGKKFSIEPIVKFSPYVIVRDHDDHLLRDKVSKGKLEGYAIMATLKGRYDFTNRFYSTLTASYTMIDADGYQHQSFSGVDYARIEQEIESEQIIASLNFGVTF